MGDDTVREANDRGYDCVIVEDATESFQLQLLKEDDTGEESLSVEKLQCRLQPVGCRRWVMSAFHSALACDNRCDEAARPRVSVLRSCSKNHSEGGSPTGSLDLYWPKVPVRPKRFR